MSDPIQTMLDQFAAATGVEIPDGLEISGLELPGGCDHCDAYQTLDRTGDQLWSMNVRHDDDCPWWIERQERTARRAAHAAARRRFQ